MYGRLIGLLLSIAIIAVYGLPWTKALLGPPRKALPDFFQDWGVAKSWREGRRIYGDQVAIARDFLGVPWDDRSPLFPTGSTRPPSCELLALPFGWLPFPHAFVLWNLLSVAALFGTLALLARLTPPRIGWWALPPTVAGLLLWDAVGWGLREGQWSLFLAFLVTAAWATDRRGAQRVCGSLLGVATAIKFFPGLLVVLLALRGRWRSVVWAAGVFVALNAGALVVFGDEAFVTYWKRVAPELGPWRGAALNVSLFGLPGRLFNPLDRQDDLICRPLVHAPVLGSFLGYGLALAILTPLAAILLRQRDVSGDFVWGAGITATLLVAPLTWTHALPMAIGPLWWWLRSGPPWLARIAVVAALWIPPSLVLRPWMPDVGPLFCGSHLSVTVLAIPTYGLLGLYFGCLRSALTHGAKEP